MQDVFLSDPRTTLHGLHDPLLVINTEGETLQANHAFNELVQRLRLTPRIAELFGNSVTSLVAAAGHDGSARAILPLACDESPHAYFRVTVSADASAETFAVLLVDVTEEMRWKRQLYERHHDLTVLRDIGVALSGTIEIDALADRIFEQTTRIMRTDNFYIALFDWKSNIVSFPLYVEDMLKQSVPSRRFANGMTEYLLRTGKPLLLSRDVLSQARELGIEPIGRACHSWIGIPMVVDGKGIGAIALQDFEHSEVYNQHDVEILTIIASQAVAAIKNAQLLVEARDAYRELSEAQTHLLETERLRGVTETVGAMNHEVNNPLAAIAGNAQLLLRHPDMLTPEARLKVEAILEAARRIERVTAKMANIIQATSMPYPGQDSILDVNRSISQQQALLSTILYQSATKTDET
jgi:GAF domain-containing protein